MQWTNFILNLMLLLSFATIIFLIKAYLPSYLNEKGKNLAQKEDIQEITNKIESVRSEHIAELEKLKSDLMIRIHNEILVQQQERDALLHFFEDCQTLLINKLNINLGDLPIDEGKSLYQHGVSVQELCISIYTDYHRLFLYFSGTDMVLQKAAEVISGVSIIQTAFKKHFWKVKTALTEEGKAFLTEDKETIKEKAKKSNDLVGAFWNDVNKGINEMDTAFENYLKELNKYFRHLGRNTGLESFYKEKGNA